MLQPQNIKSMGRNELITETDSAIDNMPKLSGNFQRLYALVALQAARLTLLEEQMKQANVMIAHNMFAIVRLEIANSCDAITNAIIEVKREKTGSGTATVVINVTGTLAMIAGNVLTGGGMSVLGGILATTGNALIAAATNDLVSVVNNVASSAATGAVSKADNAGIVSGFNLKSETVNDNTTTQAQAISNVVLAGVTGVTTLGGMARGGTQPEEQTGSFKATYKQYLRQSA